MAGDSKLTFLVSKNGVIHLMVTHSAKSWVNADCEKLNGLMQMLA